MFEDLRNLPLDECELLKLAGEEFRSNFASIDDTCYILLLAFEEDYISSVEKILTVKPHEYHDWLFSNKYLPKCILCAIQDGVAHVDLVGYFYIGDMRFTPSQNIGFFIHRYDEKSRPFETPPRELMEGAFAEFQEALAANRSKKSE